MSSTAAMTAAGRSAEAATAANAASAARLAATFDVVCTDRLSGRTGGPV